ncbi:hypothetical protein SMB59_004172 [Cronobacter muytjensii]|nr:hypothetical protein [Cronobacter muytjensii]
MVGCGASVARGSDLQSRLAIITTKKGWKLVESGSGVLIIAGGQTIGGKLAEAIAGSKATIPTKWSVDPATQAADKAAGVLINGGYIKNPTAQNLSGLLSETGRVGAKNMNGQFMYVFDKTDNIIIGTRSGQTMPHPTLIGGKDLQVIGAGIVEIRGVEIYSVDNASGHFKPGAGSIGVAKDAFIKIPSQYFSKDFQGYKPYDKN